MDLIALDRFMRKPGAPALVSLSFGAVTIGLLALAKWSRSPQRGFDFTEFAVLFAFALVGSVFAALGVLSWRRLWRSGRTPAEAFVYNFGVRRFGIGTVLLSPLFMISVMLAVGGSFSAGDFWFLIAISVMAIAMMLPMGLWLGYIAGYRRVGSAISQLGGIDETNLPSPVSEHEAG